MLNKKQQKDFRIGSLFLIVIITFVATAYVRVVEEKISNNQQLTKVIAPAVPAQVAKLDTLPLDSTYTIVGVGDMMLGTNYPSASYLPANDGKNLLDDVRKIIQAADVAFGNQEGAI